MYKQFDLFIQENAQVPEGGIEGGREATPTSISIFDSYGMKIFWFEFGYYIFAGFKMPRLQSWNACFSAISYNEIEDL